MTVSFTEDCSSCVFSSPCFSCIFGTPTQYLDQPSLITLEFGSGDAKPYLNFEITGLSSSYFDTSGQSTGQIMMCKDSYINNIKPTDAWLTAIESLSLTSLKVFWFSFEGVYPISSTGSCAQIKVTGVTLINLNDAITPLQVLCDTQTVCTIAVMNEYSSISKS